MTISQENLLADTVHSGHHIVERLRLDPASACAPFVATLVDVSGPVIYVLVALAILSRTLL